MPRSSADTLEFLLPGVLHQFGNLLLTIQGNALTLSLEHQERAQKAILSAAERGGKTLRILHDLFGEAPAVPADARELLAQLVELVRIPVREAQQVITMRAGAERCTTAVLPGPFARRFLDALRLLLRHLPRGQSGIVVTDLQASTPAHTSLRLRFEPAAGELPFPLATAELLAALDRASPEGTALTQCPPQGMGLDLLFPNATVSRDAEA